MGAFLLGIINMVPKAVYAGALGLLLFLFVVQQFQSARLRSENARYEVAVAQCVKTNTQNKEVVEFLKLQNTQCLDGRRADETNLANQVAAWNAERELLTEKAEDIEIRNVEVYRDPDCKELALLNVADVCPAFVERLRQRAESYNGIRNDND